ncbi:MAG TPA: hypothetical protein VFQ53_28845 [Kofleriaceae bacterium]|nr:hypothetical protein [Kofleriaceae bacterium]
MPGVRVALTLATLASVVACARRPAPKEPTERALFRDLERQVTVNATTGWGVDRLEIEGMLEAALDSVCRVDPLARRALRDWLDGEIARLGGPVEAAWKQRGKRMSKVDDLLVLTRVRLLLERADAMAGDCPFWIEPELPFRGRQISEHRFQITFGGGGKAIAVQQGEDVDFNAGGAGRLLFGRSFGEGHALYTGLEVGGNAAFPKDATGTRSSIELAADVVVPAVYRRTFTNSYVELEAGWLGRTTERDWGHVEHGVHVGVAFGARALRTRFVFPGAAIGLSWERVFLPDEEDLIFVKVGARVAFDLDL